MAPLNQVDHRHVRAVAHGKEHRLGARVFGADEIGVARIQFDDAPAKAYAGKQADSGKGPALFIEDKVAFIAAMSRASRLRIELPKGSGRMAVLTFEVAGYQPSRFQAP